MSLTLTPSHSNCRLQTQIIVNNITKVSAVCTVALGILFGIAFFMSLFTEDKKASIRILIVPAGGAIIGCIITACSFIFGCVLTNIERKPYHPINEA